MLLLPLKKKTAPAPCAAAEPEITGKGVRPCQFYAAVKLPTLIMEPLKTSVFRDTHNIKAKIRKFKKLLFYLKFQIIDGKVAYINIFI